MRTTLNLIVLIFIFSIVKGQQRIDLIPWPEYSSGCYSEKYLQSLLMDKDSVSNSSMPFTFILDKEDHHVFLDSMSCYLLADTIRFGDNIAITEKAKSPIFIIDGKYFYIFQMKGSKPVYEFMDTYFDASIINKITIGNRRMCTSIFGTMGYSGCVIIDLKANVKYNPKIAGLKWDKNKRRKSGRNF